MQPHVAQQVRTMRLSGQIRGTSTLPLSMQAFANMRNLKTLCIEGDIFAKPEDPVKNQFVDIRVKMDICHLEINPRRMTNTNYAVGFLLRSMEQDPRFDFTDILEYNNYTYDCGCSLPIVASFAPPAVLSPFLDSSFPCDVMAYLNLSRHYPHPCFACTLCGEFLTTQAFASQRPGAHNSAPPRSVVSPIVRVPPRSREDRTPCD